MKQGRYRSLLTAAALVLATASAAETRKTPKMVMPEEPKMVPCPGMGDGFARIEGSGTCVRLSGSMRAEFAHIAGRSGSSADR